MTVDIWAECSEQVAPILLDGEVFRVVESQEKVATNELVDNFEEQAILEEMIDGIKPAIPKTAQDLDYLLFTPFRYPPLEYGSRFGRRFEPSLFYGSRTLATALAETAYYRLHFWLDMSVPPPSGKLKTQHSAFTTQFSSVKGLKLYEHPFSVYEAKLIDKASYNDSQVLGTSMRENDIETFEYISARDPERGLNIGIFKPEVLTGKKPTSMTSILCSTHESGVEFMDENSVVYKYSVDEFLHNDVFPSLNS